jgi:hypothetical protein
MVNKMLHLSSLPGALLYIGATLLIYYSLGYIALNRIIRTRLRNYGTFVSLPMYLATGVVLLTFILYPIAVLIFNSLIAYLVLIAIIACVLREVILSKRRSLVAIKKSSPADSTKDDRKKSVEVVAGIAFALTLLYIAIFTAISRWPPPGDLINHGFYTSLIIYDQRIPTTFYPFRDAAFLYPLGYHINAAFLTLVLGIYPGESVFLFGGVLMIILASLIFTLTYVMTRSILLSALSYALLYLVNTSGSLETWVFGYLVNGTYPNIYGFTVILFSVTAVAIYAEVKDQYIFLRLFPILMIALLLTYPSFIIVPVVLLIVVAFQTGIRKAMHWCVGTRRDILITIFLVLSFIWAGYNVYSHVYHPTIERSVISAWYEAPQSYLFNSLFGYSMIMASILSAFLILFSFLKGRKRYLFSPDSTGFAELRSIFVTYVLIDLMLLLSLNPYLFGFLQYVLPSRLTVLIMILSIVVDIYALSRIADIIIEKLRNSVVRKNPTATKSKTIKDLTKELCFIGILLLPALLIPQIYGLAQYTSAGWLIIFILPLSLVPGIYAVNKILGIIIGKKQSSSTLKRKLHVNSRNILVGLTVFLFFNASGTLLYSLSSHASLQLANGSAWYTNTAMFQDDSKALEWMQANATSGELILNDFSWSGLYLLSFSIKNVSMNYLLRGLGRAEELENIWLHPGNATLVHSLLKKYNVSYVLVTSALEFYDYLGDSRYKSKPYLPSVYVVLFYTYDFLEPVFRSGSSAVFKVK